MDPELLQLSLAVKVRKEITQALSQYKMIAPHDRVLVAVSGGKDSSVLVVLLNEIQRRAPFEFTLEAVMLDQMAPGFSAEEFKGWIDGLGIPFTIVQKDTYSVVREKIQNKIYCSLCARLRRGILYNFAFEKGFHKIALGHHREDLNETLLMNVFFNGNLASMSPKYKSKDKRNTIIRPLCFVAEEDIIELAQQWKVPIIPCGLCGSQDNMQRKKMKALIKNLSEDIPFVQNSMIKAQSNVDENFLMDKRLKDFEF